MNFTGERYVPNQDIDMQMTYEHTHRYEYICKIVKDKVVLDIASGEGYGSAIIAEVAASVTGIDIDPEAIQHASLKYSGIDNLHFECGSVTEIPLSAHSVDVIVSFETIEHIAEHDEMLNEFRRVLKNDGILIISTPDKKIYTDESGEVNEFHIKELYKDEFYTLLNGFFEHVELCGQRFLTLSSILPLNSESSISDKVSIVGNLQEKNSVYLLAICSNVSLKSLVLDQSLYFNSELDLYAKDKSILRWASSVHHELMKSQQDYFRLESEFLAYKESIESNNKEDDKPE